MFPPLFPIYIPALVPLHDYGTLIWLAGLVCLWLTRYTHQLGQRLGVRGTPSMILENGEMVPGYVPPAQLAQMLDGKGK